MSPLKPLKFKQYLADLIIAGNKNTTWRLFDDKNLQIGDRLCLIVSETGEEFRKAIITEMKVKKMCEITEEDYSGHERFPSHEIMIQTYNDYYGGKVRPETSVKIIKFALKQ